MELLHYRPNGGASSDRPGGGRPTSGVVYCQLEVHTAPCPENFFWVSGWTLSLERLGRTLGLSCKCSMCGWVRIACKPRLSSRLLPKLLGFLQWHDRPRVGSGPFLAGAHCHDRWGNLGPPTPVKILHSLVTILVRCAEPWKSPAHSKLSLARGMFVRDIAGSDFFGPSLFVDAAWDKFGYRVGGVVPRRGVRSWAVQSRVANQQEARL